MNQLRERLERRIDELPMLPTVAARLMTLDPDSEDYFEEVLELLQSDPAFAVRVLSTANSAASAPLKEITSLRAALARLGGAATTQAALALAVSRVFVPRDPIEKSLWRHAILVGGATRSLNAMLPGERSATADDAYVAGLLHDVGHFVLFQEVPESLHLIHEASWDTPEDLLAAEHEYCGMTHCELGAIACEHWGLPEGVGSLVRSHHEPETAPAYVRELARIVKFADWVMFPAVLPGTPGNEESSLEVVETQLLPRLPAPWSLSAEELLSMTQRVTEDATATFAALGLK